MKRIQLGVCEFALPVPRVGSIEAYSGFSVTQEGIEIHRRVQELRSSEDPYYRSEVKIHSDFEVEEFSFRINGKMDGLFDGKKPRIEEIKTSFNLQDIKKKLKNKHHPYRLQLQTYGYFYYLHRGTVPDLSFCLVSSRNGKTEDLKVDLELDEYELWLRSRLSELAGDARASRKRIEKRKAIASQFAFPFENPRPGQESLMAAVTGSIQEGKRMFVQAPTGLGKTVGVLHPLLKEALSRGQRVVYITPKNSQHSVAEDAVERFKENHAKVRSLTVTAKSKICFKNEPICNPDYCEYAKDHYTKMYQHNLKELLSQKRKITSRVVRKMAEEFQVCPFELQMEAAIDADVTICDYNYVFSPRSAFTQMAQTAIGHEGKPSLVIDEAHNLFSRALGYYSPELSTVTLERMRNRIREIPSSFSATAEKLLDSCIDTVKSQCPEKNEKAAEIEPQVGLFLEQEAELRNFLSRYLESEIDIQPKDPVLRLCFYWSEFTEALGFVSLPKREEFFTTFRKSPDGGGTLRIVCCDASQMLKKCYDQFDHVVGFSATLKPFDYYLRLSGLEPEEVNTAEFHSPFPGEHRKLLIIPEISTKYSDRERNYTKIAEAIRKISEVKKGNYFAFFPSFEFLDHVLSRFHPPEGFTVLRQAREMKASDTELILEHLKSKSTPTLVFAVQGGVFAEGVDYPGETVIGAFVIGPPLPPFDLEREKMRTYYDKKYGAGFDYAYTFPAMAKAVQAAGRVIRSETDRGLIVLMDTRFLHRSYSQSMPKDWFQEEPRELVSRSILKDVQGFWDSTH